ncbi:MAG: hypothetical protein A2Y03_03445 [Omnitrophica WOR_2 bacterium GWF2_38_59]|nr:MAG: hypothetical protein A2Y06_07470 [Omnitrophica WOR_2 bacterium GWA2_37_7]OGX23368.1 MAG: hypothetical protein A2Y03_03445 [Omnitrophica WOR_2 bacterium GWF2_38_59]OGX50697.1 MAG: hypothetical protein A2243_01490 [Omnitrophica WOR_2 bacterium RIFOXYA2_FULL_38_17]OGX53228.1 MAG: hypothetical protein A2267_04450 [Omnitrophica WOR_2 bacterium RIFOXYA12_FULL_38_10]OGX57400.1 MAG: hypothetical protein A2447_03765 [Omnitrophica WOR_2 bacterium RIFOXYC2_FULL_38_12]OGX60329.1 MAG: hypothetical 
MSNTLPPIFIERLRKLIPNQDLGSCLDSFSLEKVISIRANTLKNSFDEVCSCLDERGIKYSSVKWFKDALILHDVKWEQIRESSLFSEGLAYRQSISSMLVPVILSPEPDEDILDLCAAPGSKTTQIAAMMKNKGCITAVDIVKGRYYKLRSVAQLLGAENIEFKLIDGRRLRSPDKLFDRVLIDAPCSSEGRFSLLDKKSYAYWSPRKIKEMCKKQRGLLLNAARLLKNDGLLVYSTCTFAPEENEAVVDWLIKKIDRNITVEKIDVTKFDLPTYTAVTEWEGKVFDEKVNNCLRVLPSRSSDGFFITKIRF